MRILGISGSLRADSHNTRLLHAAVRLLPEDAELELLDPGVLRSIPPYDEDVLLADGEPPAATELRRAIERSDAVLFATPEYNHSLPGAFKNALDWLVGSGEFVDKPVAIMSAGGGGGEYVLRILGTTLEVMSARVVAALGVGGVRSKRDEHGDIVDPPTLDAIIVLLADLREAVGDRR